MQALEGLHSEIGASLDDQRADTSTVRRMRAEIKAEMSRALSEEVSNLQEINSGALNSLAMNTANPPMAIMESMLDVRACKTPSPKI